MAKDSKYDCNSFKKGSDKSESNTWDELRKRSKCEKDEITGPECHESHKPFKKQDKNGNGKLECEGTELGDVSEKTYDNRKTFLKDGSYDGKVEESQCRKLEGKISSESVDEVLGQPCPSPIKTDSVKETCTSPKTESILASCACQESQRKQPPSLTSNETNVKPCSSEKDKFLQKKPKSCTSKRADTESEHSSIPKTPTDECCKSSTSTGKAVKEDCAPRGGSSAYAKLVNCCKEFAKQYVTPKTKPKQKCSSAAKIEQRNECERKFGKIESRLPSEPKTEKRFGCGEVSKSKCVVPDACPRLKQVSFADFFPLDARNKKLNDCIEKYTRIDPSQVIEKCSQFVSKRKDEGCQKSFQQPQKKCLAARDQAVSRGGRRFALPANTRQLLGRWAPSAGVYLATSALIGLYVTEWKTVLGHVPGYSHVAERPDD